MAFAFVDSVNNQVAPSSSIDASHSFAVGTLLIGVYAFANVAANSGPWSDPNGGQQASDHIGPFTGWQQACWIGPSAAGVGIEVWCAINNTTSAGGRTLSFKASQTCQLVMGAWTGAYAPTSSIFDGAVRDATTAQVVGHAPSAPSISANVGDLIVACGGDLMTASKFGTPPGFTNELDIAGGGAGTVEATIADATANVAGATGLITFPNNAAAASTAGTTATLAIRPAASAAAAGTGGVIDAGLPEDLDIGAGYTLRVTALDPGTGSTISGVTVSNLVFDATQISGTPGELEVGPFMLVPGPGA